MKLEVAYNEKETETLGIQKSQNFGMSKDAEEMVFSMFTKHIYSNPIGSVVREITSNCFDSHKEAGVKDAVVVRLTKENADFYISFIDKGVGMSRERITKVYAQYFSSTKRNDNNQIGGFGIGGKTPLAYTESFFLITRYNGIEYTYNIRKGLKSPVLDLLDSTRTKEGNGTIIKIPVKQSDIGTFEREIVRQLYYFENVIFEGFSSTVKNDYKIIEGQHFLYRGDDYNPYFHICLGRVAYPIDYNVLHDEDFEEYNWDVPVAIKLEIGEINVTASREAIDYNEATKKLIKKKMALVKQELVAMLQKQHEKLNSLEEYYALLDNHSMLRLKGDALIDISSLTRKEKYEKPTFKRFNSIDIPTPTELIAMFYETSEIGKISSGRGRGRRRGRTMAETWDKSLKGIDQLPVYLLGHDEVVPRKKNTFLKFNHKKYYTIKRRALQVLENNRNIEKVTPEKSTVDANTIANQYYELQADAYKLIEKQVKLCADVVVPEGFTVTVSKYDPSYEIPLGTFGWNSRIYRTRYKLVDLADTQAVFYYGTSDNEHTLLEYKSLFEAAFPKMKETKKAAIGEASEGMPVNFVIIAKNNLKHIESLKNFKPVNEAAGMFLRKRQQVLNNMERNMFESAYNDLANLFMNEKLFANVDADYAKTIKALKKLRSEYNSLPKVNINAYNGSLASKVFGIKSDKIKIKGQDLIAQVKKTTEKNNMLRFINITSDFDPKSNYYGAKDIADLMQLLKTAYVK